MAGQDSVLSVVPSVTNVYVSNDLQVGTLGKRMMHTAQMVAVLASSLVLTTVWSASSLVLLPVWRTQVVKIYVSIYSDDFGKKRAMSNLKRMESYVRREMGQRVSQAC